MNTAYLLKRCMDIIFSLVALFLLLPLWILISIGIYLEDRGPIFFPQKRLGKSGKIYTMYKFRSMYRNNVPPLELGTVKYAHPLVTKIGYLIRRSKLDETPQFLNILLGQMSLVGPRPCLPARLNAMTAFEKKRLQLLPGLTGWAEVNGNIELSWEEQLWLDIWYVENCSLGLDFKILLKTIVVVFLGAKRNESALEEAKQKLLHD